MQIKVGRGRSTKKVATISMNDRKASQIIEGKTGRLGRTYQGVTTRGVKASTSIHRDLPRVNSLINDNQCITLLQEGLLTGNTSVPRTINSLNVTCHVANLGHTAPGHSQRKELSPGSAGCYVIQEKLKYVKGVSCVTQLSCAKPVTNVPIVVTNLPVGARLLGNLAASGCQSESSSNPERGLHPPLSDPAKTHKVSYSHKLLCQSPQEQLPAGGIASAYRQKCSGASKKQILSGLFQPAIFSLKAKQEVETYIRSEQSEFFPQGGEIQDGDTGNHQDIPPTRGVGHLNRLQGRLLPYTNTGTIQEISEISRPRADISIQSTAFRSVHSSLGVHCGSKRGETDGHTQGYKDPPVPRRLVGESQIPPGLSPAYSRSSKDMPGTRLASEFGKVRTGTQADLRFCRLPVRPQGQLGPTYTGPLAEPSGQSIRNIVTTSLSCPAAHVPYRSANSNRKPSSPRPTTYETHTVASQKQLEGTRVTRKGDSNSQIIAPSSTVVAAGGQRSHRPTITPNKTCSANLYRRIKRRVGRSLKRTHCKRVRVPTRKQAAYKLSGVKSSLLSSKRVPRPLYLQNGTCSNRQHYSSVIHKQGGRHEVGPTLCPSMENLDLVHQPSSNSQSPTHPRPAERGSRQAIMSRPDYSNRMIPPSRGFSNHMQQVAPAQHSPICHEVQQQITSVVSPVPDPLATAVDALSLPWRIWTLMTSHQQPSWAKWWRSCRTPHARESF